MTAMTMMEKRRPKIWEPGWSEDYQFTDRVFYHIQYPTVVPEIGSAVYQLSVRRSLKVFLTSRYCS